MRQHGLADGVVDLVRAGVVQVFALEVNLCAADFAADTRGVVDRRRAAYKMGQFGFEFSDELGVVLVLGVGRLQFIDRVGQRFGDKTAAVGAEMASAHRVGRSWTWFSAFLQGGGRRFEPQRRIGEFFRGL